MKRGEVVGERFVIDRLLGSGGMGEVFLAYDRFSGLPVALKVFASGGADQRARFEREAEVLASLEHPGIVRYVAHGAPPNGDFYLAMECLEGEDLFARLERGPLSIDDTVLVARRTAAALAVTHARGIAHRDIKPANLFLVGGSVAQLKILDFGIARIEATSTLTRAGFALGTPDYMSPEQARGDAVLSPAIDVFSLGCVLFECLTGRTPFAAAHPLGVLSRVLLEDAERVRTLRPDTPPALDELVATLLTKPLDQRPPDATAALARIDEAIQAIARMSLAEARADTVPSLTSREQQLLCLLFVDAETGEGVGAPGGADASAAAEWIGAEHGARVEHLLGGTLLVTLPGRGSLSEQALRAARCAVGLRSRLPHRRIALVTGRADLTSSRTVGDLIDRGLDLLGRAKIDAEGAIRIDATTADLIDSSFVIERGGDGPRISKAVAESSARTLLGREQPFYGREDVFEQIGAQFGATLAQRAAHAVLVTGLPGIGKSRLRTEIARVIASRDPGAFILLGRGDPTRFGEPFGLVSSSMRTTFGIQDDQPIAVRHERIRRYVGAALGVSPSAGEGHAAGVERVAEFLGELMRVPFPDERSPLLAAARADGIRMGDQMWRAWQTFVDGVTRQRTMVLVLDDVDFSDLPSLKFIDAALRNLHDRPLFVIAFARPEVDERFPGLWAARRLTRIALGPLTDRASEMLVHDALGPTATPTITQRIVERGGGNPLYLEEMVRALSSGLDSVLPTTVVAMVEARLDALAPETRRILRAASVFGRVSWRRAILLLCGGVEESVDAALQDLVRREILVVRGSVTFHADVELAFRHGLVRDAAYAMLTEEDRTLGHDLAGRWLAEHRPGEALTIAQHFAKGGQAHAAVAWYARSAELALEGNDFLSAIDRAEQAIACGAEGLALGKLKLLISDCHRLRGANVAMLERADEAREILVRGSIPWFRAVANIVNGAMRVGNRAIVLDCIADLSRELRDRQSSPLPAPAARVAHYLHFAGQNDFATRLLSGAWSDRDTGDAGSGGDMVSAERSAWFHRASATRALMNGDVASYLEHLERAVQSFERAGDVREPVNERVNMGFARLELGLYREAEATLRAAVVDADAMGLLHASATSRENLGAVLIRLGQLDEAETHLETAIEAFAKQENRRMEGNARVYLGELRNAQGDAKRAEEALRTAIELLTPVKPLLPMAEAVLAELLLATNRVDEGIAMAARASAGLASIGHLDEGESLVHLVEIEALLAQGKSTEAREAAESARQRLLERAGRIREPAWRTAFLGVRENARILELASSLGEGQPVATPS